MQRQRQRRNTYVAPEIFHLERAVQAVHEALIPSITVQPTRQEVTEDGSEIEVENEERE